MPKGKFASPLGTISISWHRSKADSSRLHDDKVVGEFSECCSITFKTTDGSWVRVFEGKRSSITPGDGVAAA